MPVTAATPSRARRATRRTVVMGTTTVIAFAFTLLGAGLVILTGTSPVHLPLTHSTEIGGFLFFMPLVALTLALVVEVARVALRHSDLPATVEPRRIAWAEPSRRD